MVKIYGMMICPDCVNAKQLFMREGIPFEYLDFNASTQNLKDFLKLRDSNPMFDSVRAEGKIGIPCIVLEDGTITLCPEDVLKS